MAVTEAAQTEKNATALIYPQGSFMIDVSIQASTEQIEESARALLKARIQGIWLGDQIVKDGSYPEALELAELLSIPVCDSWVWGNSAPFPHRHSLYAGYYDDKGKDLILAFGMTGAEELLLDKSNAATIVRCSTYSRSEQQDNPGDISITANTKDVSWGIIDAVKSMATESTIRKISAHRAGAAPDFANAAALQYESQAAAGPVHPDELGSSLQSELDQNCIFVDENIQGSKRFFNFGPGADDKLLVQGRRRVSGLGRGRRNRRQDSGSQSPGCIKHRRWLPDVCGRRILDYGAI